MPSISRSWRAVGLATIVALAAPAMAAAQSRSPAALVEEVTGRVSGVAEMDYMASGRVIRLAPQDRLVLSYLRSCQRETITGGVVTVGAERSDVQNGNVRRETITCDAGRLRLSPQQAARSGVMVFRGTPAPQAVQAEITIYARAPVVDGVGAGPLVIQRMDKAADQIAVNVTPAIMRKRAVDLAKAGIRLDAGGIYTLKAGERRIVFKVAPDARDDGGPLLGRLLRL
jgi:hypothetical protein